MLDIIIPVQEETEMLDGCIRSIEDNTSEYNLHIYKNPKLNVAEARQEALDTLKLGRYVCFLDDDSRMLEDGWDKKLIGALSTGIISSFAEECWGKHGVMRKYSGVQPIEFGPAACMMLDMDQLPIGYKWDKYIGLRSGWLGGDFEEVEFILRLQGHQLGCVGVEGSRFLHLDRPDLCTFVGTDRGKTCQIMYALIQCKQATGNNPEFFRKLEYVKANPNNDRMLAPGQTLKKCFNGVIRDNHLEHYPMFIRWGLV